jgi:LysR family glycine cleavage system transcriptional activator
LQQGRLAAEAVASGTTQSLRLAVLPSFAQRWLLPRIGRWQARHPAIPIEVETSQRLVDLQREGFDAALRQGMGNWRGLQAERLIDSPLIAVGAPAAAARLQGRGTASLADERLLGTADLWARWFALDGCQVNIAPVANFNDAGLMLQATEQDIGIALTRELLAADALADGRLVRLSPLALPDTTTQAYWLVYPPERVDSPALVALRTFLHDEMARSAAGLQRPAALKPARRGRAAARR